MTTKENTIAKLIELGYDAKLENGVVMIYYEGKEEYKSINDSIHDVLRLQLDYQESFGICPKNNIPKL